eukprot:scaffold152594_cov20-Tisochrysis_lutea.AAC.2
MRLRGGLTFMLHLGGVLCKSNNGKELRVSQTPDLALIHHRSGILVMFTCACPLYAQIASAGRSRAAQRMMSQAARSAARDATAAMMTAAATTAAATAATVALVRTVVRRRTSHKCRAQTALCSARGPQRWMLSRLIKQVATTEHLRETARCYASRPWSPSRSISKKGARRRILGGESLLSGYGAVRAALGGGSVQSELAGVVLSHLGKGWRGSLHECWQASMGHAGSRQWQA